MHRVNQTYLVLITCLKSGNYDRSWVLLDSRKAEVFTENKANELR